MKSMCKNCKWYMDPDGVCVNGDSDHRGDFVHPEFCCPHHDFNADTVRKAAKIVNNELLKRDELYKAFLECINSAIAAKGVFKSTKDRVELSEYILKRIIGAM